MPQSTLTFLSFFRIQFLGFLGLFLKHSKSHTNEPNSIFYTIILFFSFSFLVARDPPANDNYQTATELTVQQGSCSTQIEEDLANATNSNDYAHSSPCIDGYENDNKYLDLLNKATVPPSGKLTIQTSAVSGSSVIGIALFAYTFSDGV